MHRQNGDLGGGGEESHDYPLAVCAEGSGVIAEH